MASALLRSGACLALLSKVSGATVSPTSCDAEDGACGSDETPFLQVATNRASRDEAVSNSSWCPGGGYPMTQTSQCMPLLREDKVEDFFGWWSLPPQDLSSYSSLPKFNVERYLPYQPGSYQQRVLDASVYSRVGAAEGAKMMYEATKVQDVFEHVPEQLRGVFWMKGNGIAEELAVLQYGQWFEDENMYVAGWGPMMWSWADGMPKHAPGFGMMYSKDGSAASLSIASFSLDQNAISHNFSTCPSYADCYGHDYGTPKDMSFAHMQIHKYGKLKDVNTLSPTGGAFTLEAQRGGESWVRKCKWGSDAGATCATVDFGSYQLTRILDGDGQPVVARNVWGVPVNWYDEFVKYMGSVKMVVWSGFKSEQARKSLARYMSHR